MKEKRPPRRRNLPITFSIKSFVFEDVEGFQPTTVPQLRLLCWKIKPWKQPKSNKLFSSQFGVQWNVDCDEVFPGRAPILFRIRISEASYPQIVVVFLSGNNKFCTGF